MTSSNRRRARSDASRPGPPTPGLGQTRPPASAPAASVPADGGNEPLAAREPALREADRPGAAATASPLLDAMPEGLREPLHYFLARAQMTDDAKALPRRVGVTSCTHGEGVTTIARALAAAIVSDLDTRVCLVDLAPEARGEMSAPGLAAVVASGLPVERALTPTADERLFVLGSGTDDAPHSRLLARSTEFATALTRLDDQFDYLVFDVPPVLEGSEALSLLRHTEGYLLVVQHGATTVEQVRAAVDELRSLRSLGVVLNQFSTRIPKRLRRFFAA